MSVPDWIVEHFYDGELFFYVIPVFLFILLLIVIFMPEEEPERDGEEDQEKPDETDDIADTAGDDSAEEVVSVPEPVESDVSEADVAEPPAAEERGEDEKITEEKSVEDTAAPTSYSEGLARTRNGFMSKLMQVFSTSVIDDEMLEEMEEILYTADVGTTTVTSLLEETEKNRGSLKSGEAVRNFLKSRIRTVLRNVEKPFVPQKKGPLVLLMIGVNGAGKTTTIAKLVTKLRKEHSMESVIAAADTFRAAAREQIETWGERVNAEVIADREGADPGAVTYNAIHAAQAQHSDVVIVDTAGRLQNRVNLMKELEKVYRVAGKAMEGAPHEVLLVLDANSGQNAVSQARQFSEHVPVSGLVVTKLDGTAKGGAVIGIAAELELPIYFIGIGERAQDLVPFEADKYVEALFD